MKTKFTLLFITIVSAFNMNAQIEGLDASHYYTIQTVRKDTEGKQHAFGINMADMATDGAMVEQQLADGLSEGQLWQVIPVTDSTYRFKNKLTGMALGRTEWRGTNPAITDPNEAAWNFNWRGVWWGACQRIWNAADEWQVWQPFKLGESAAGDTVFYSIASTVYFSDSCFAWNLWRNSTVIETDPLLLHRNKNVALFSGKTQQAESYTDPTNNYSYFFTQSILEVPPSVIGEDMMENIHVYSSNGSIFITGELYGKYVDIYSILGKKVYSKLVDASEVSVPVRQGLYIVKAGDRVTKLVVR